MRLTVTEVARALACDRKTVYRACAAYLNDHEGWDMLPPKPGQLPCVRLGNRYLIPREALERMGLL